MSKVVRIGGASGFWGDSAVGAPQLVRSGQIDYLVFDYLAEITMSLLARARAKSPESGYAPDFVKVIAQLAPRIQAQGIRVVANAGGVNPQGCADALAALAAEQGVALQTAVVTGDDLMPQLLQAPAAVVQEASLQLLPWQQQAPPPVPWARKCAATSTRSCMTGPVTMPSSNTGRTVPAKWPPPVRRSAARR